MERITAPVILYNGLSDVLADPNVIRRKLLINLPGDMRIEDNHLYNSNISEGRYIIFDCNILLF